MIALHKSGKIINKPNFAMEHNLPLPCSVFPERKVSEVCLGLWILMCCLLKWPLFLLPLKWRRRRVLLYKKAASTCGFTASSSFSPLYFESIYATCWLRIVKERSQGLYVSQVLIYPLKCLLISRSLVVVGFFHELLSRLLLNETTNKNSKQNMPSHKHQRVRRCLRFVSQ